MGVNSTLYIKFSCSINRMDEILLEFGIENGCDLVYIDFYPD